jgi:hypothetical protein
MRIPLGSRSHQMAYLTAFSANADLPLSQNGHTTPDSVLDFLERSLYEYDADITHRGEGSLTFKVPNVERLLRTLRPRVGGWGPWWPFDYVSSGTLSVIATPTNIRVSAAIEASQWHLLPAGLLAMLAGTAGPFHSPLERSVLGLLVGLASAVLFIFLGKWQFGSWLHRVVHEATSHEAAA